MRTRHLAAVLVVVMLVMPTALGVVRGSPELQASAPDNRVVADEDTQFEVTLTNEGDLETGSPQNPSLNDEVTNARAVEATLHDRGAPVTVKTDTRVLSQLPRGESATLPYAISVADDAEPGSYEMELEVEYRYTSVIGEQNGARNEQSETERFDVTVVVEERAEFAVVESETDVRIGESGTVSVTMENTGSDTARDTTVGLESLNGDMVFGESATANRFVGDWEPGERRTVEYRLRATPDAREQRYTFRATATFDDGDGVTRESPPLPLGVTPGPETTFAVVESETDVRIGESGTVAVTMENTGSDTVQDATVRLESLNDDLRFGESASASRYVGDWEAGERETVEYRVRATNEAEQQRYALRATTSFDGSDGDPRESEPLSLGVMPGPETTFSLGGVSGDLRVGEERDLRGTVTNDADTAARDVVVRLTTENENIQPAEREYSVGTLEPGESADIRYSLEVSESADAGPRQFTFVAEYRDADGDTRESDDLVAREQVRPGADTFAVEVAEGRLQRGESSQLTVEVTNRGNETLTDISAKLFADSPVSAEDDEEYVRELAPGESARLTFRVSADGTALAKDYPVSMDFQYDDEDGDTQLSDTYRVPVTVTEQEGSGGLSLPLIGGLLVAVLVAVGGYVRLR